MHRLFAGAPSGVIVPEAAWAGACAQASGVPGVAATSPTGHGGIAHGLRRHLAGDYSLARAYFLHLFLITQAFDLLSSLAIEIAGEQLPARYAALIGIVLALAAYVLWFVLSAGTWVSACKHRARGGKASLANVAKAAILVMLVLQIFSVPETVKAIGDNWGTVKGAQPGAAPRLRLSADGRSVALSGGINDGTADRLAALLARAPHVTTVVLASPGGWTREGRLIGNVIAAHGLNTHVAAGTACSSSCTLAFLAGRVRTADAGARLGFHTFGPGNRQFGDAAARKAYARLHMDGDFIARVTATAHDDIWFPKAEELARYHVLTVPQGGTRPLHDSRLARL